MAAVDSKKIKKHCFLSKSGGIPRQLPDDFRYTQKIASLFRLMKVGPKSQIDIIFGSLERPGRQGIHHDRASAASAASNPLHRATSTAFRFSGLLMRIKTISGKDFRKLIEHLAKRSILDGICKGAECNRCHGRPRCEKAIFFDENSLAESEGQRVNNVEFKMEIYNSPLS
ncbi:MAG: hypothetical protein P8X90_17710 [Desulfobacterales bacterium]